MSFQHIDALIRFHLPQYEPDDLITANEDGSLNFDKYAEIWCGLEWVLKNKEF